MLATTTESPTLQTHPLARAALSRAAARWCRSRAMTCRCSTRPACSRNTSIPAFCRPVRRLAYGPDRAAAEIRQGRGRGAGAGAAGAAGHRWRCAGTAALCPVHQCGRRHSRRPDGGEFRRATCFWWSMPPARPHDEAHLRARLSERLRHRAACRSRADRAAGAEGEIGTGESYVRKRPRCASWMPGRAASTASTASSRARATPARTALRFRFRRNRRRRSRRRCLTTAT